MAKHRCYSVDIVRSDAFLDLPVSSRELYFQLGMEGDDRGYVNNVKTIIRICGATWGDLEQLINKKFVLLREKGLVVVKGWRINNSIQPSRLVETKYIDDFKTLFIDENGSYTETPTQLSCQQFVDNLSTQDKISKDKISKVKLSKDKKENIILSASDNIIKEKDSASAADEGENDYDLPF